jgi:hypothetical protein
MRIDDRDWPLIYCDTCQDVQPLRSDVMPTDDRNEYASIDLICGTCDSVITTLDDTPKKKKGANPQDRDAAESAVSAGNAGNKPPHASLQYRQREVLDESRPDRPPDDSPRPQRIGRLGSRYDLDDPA